MRISMNSVFVDDQAKAQKFYTEKLGFVTKVDVPAGGARWLTVVSPDDPNGTELLLEPNGHPAAVAYQKAIFADGIPATAFTSTNIHEEYERLKARGVVFTKEPTQFGPAIIATFEDTCGNLIQMLQVVGQP
ncbi:VOC family protein [Myxococcus sp. K38C18041901]|uniref:VOC family protein n=1 Tax=Myxococcus guangdongensis TaxID=2906760 RepID=UPI0020A7B1E0|nr:VOC family protein [Myxococcus guangdongensis]MCP3062288.1 VOC family protein [Myxococcus guangdongensis]